MATGGDTPAEARSRITFGVTLEVPWNTPEAYVQLHSDGVFDLDTVLDVLGLCGRRLNAAVVRVLQGRDARSVHALIPRRHGGDGGAGGVGGWLQWPVTVVQSMTWLQNELDAMCTDAKKRYRHSR